MITKEEIKKAASKYAKGNAPTADQPFCAIDFRAGARWAIEQMQAENERLNLKNAAIAGERDAAILEAGQISGRYGHFWMEADAAIRDIEAGNIAGALDRLKKLIK